MQRGYICRVCGNISYIDSLYSHNPVGPLCPYCHNHLWYYSWITPLVVPIFSWEAKNEYVAMPKIRYIHRNKRSYTPLVIVAIISMILFSAGFLLFAETFYSNISSVIAHTVEVSGHVFENTGVPVQNAMLQINGVSTRTDASGYFLFHLQSGIYNISIMRNGYNTTYVQDVVVSALYVSDLGALYITHAYHNKNSVNWVNESAYSSWSDYISSIYSGALYFIFWGLMSAAACPYIYKRERFGFIVGSVAGVISVPFFMIILPVPLAGIFNIFYMLALISTMVAIAGIFALAYNSIYYYNEVRYTLG